MKNGSKKIKVASKTSKGGSSKFLVVIVTTMVDMVTPEMEVTMLKATITTTVDMVVDMMTLPSPARDRMVTVMAAAALAILLTKTNRPEEDCGNLAKSRMEAGDMMMLVMMHSTNTGPNNFIFVERTEEGMGMVLILFIDDTDTDTGREGVGRSKVGWLSFSG
jgi:hypothetical protein